MGSVDLLQSVAGTAERVTVTVSECWYACCSRGWRQRGEGTYAGRVSRVDGADFLMLGDGIGTLTFALTARLDAVLSVESG